MAKLKLTKAKAAKEKLSESGKASMGLELPKGIYLKKTKSSEILHVGFMYNGVYYRHSTGLALDKTNLEHAKNLLSGIKDRIFRNQFDYENFFPGSKQASRATGGITESKTIGDALNKYLKDIEAKVNKSGQQCTNTKYITISYSTFVGYRKIIKRLFNSLGDIPIKSFTSANIHRWISQQTASGKTIANHMSVLNAVLRDAYSHNEIKENPFDRFKEGGAWRKLKTSPNKKSQSFSEDEINLILNHITDEQVKNAIQFLFWSGLRISEMISLTWQDIDFESKTISVNKARIGNFSKSTKTEAGKRIVPMLNGAMSALKSQENYRKYDLDEIFLNPNTNRPWSSSNKLNSQFNKVIRSLGLVHRPCFCTRHSFATLMDRYGIDKDYIAKIMGHTSSDVTMKHYINESYIENDKLKEIFQ